VLSARKSGNGRIGTVELVEGIGKANEGLASALLEWYMP
jgi:hypothetical protein